MTLRGGLALKNRYNDSGETNVEVLEQERIQLDARLQQHFSRQFPLLSP